ncbi:MAG: gamma-glutamyltransferase, partial [Anaerolineales bacterium]
KIVAKEIMYGVNTGIGEFSEVVLTGDQVKQFQRYLIYNHAAGIGEPTPIEYVRAAIAGRINVHAHGKSGCRPVITQTLVGMLNKGVTPVVCQKGSVGACGDLAPMSQIALPLMSEGEAFYQGEIAEAIVKVIQDAGGVMDLQDLADHHSDWVDPISTDYQGYRVWECPPNGQGLAALLALNILENFDLLGSPLLSTKRLHLLIEAMRLAFADTRWYIADPDHSKQPIQALLSKQYAAQRAALIDPSKATIDQQRGTPTSDSDTVYLTVVDKDGNACSFINSNYMGFGTGFVPKGWGFTLQNRGHGFSLEDGHPNALAPLKRPYHTIIPSMITHEDTGALFSSFGVMGGFMQPQGHMQVALSLIENQLDPQSALDLPRFCITNGEAGGHIALENGITFETLAELTAMGHQIQPVSGHNRALFGRGQVILRDRESAVLWGGSDPRTDGLAMTFT